MLADQEGQKLVCLSRKVGGCVPVNGGVIQQDLTDLRTAIHTKDTNTTQSIKCPQSSGLGDIHSAKFILIIIQGSSSYFIWVYSQLSQKITWQGILQQLEHKNNENPAATKWNIKPFRIFPFSFQYGIIDKTHRNKKLLGFLNHFRVTEKSENCGSTC